MVIAVMLGLLIGPYLILTAVTRVWGTIRIEPHLRGRISLAIVFVFTGHGHFIMTEPMAQMLPPWVPMRMPIIYITGVSNSPQPPAYWFPASVASPAST